MISKYEYMRISQHYSGGLSDTYFSVVEEYAKQGWRFVCVVPCATSDGFLNQYDLIFEKEI